MFEKSAKIYVVGGLEQDVKHYAKKKKNTVQNIRLVGRYVRILRTRRMLLGRYDRISPNLTASREKT